MSDQYAISAANLNYIERNLNAIHSDLGVLSDNVGTVNDNVKVVYDEIGQLAQDFGAFVTAQQNANNLMQAQQRIIQIRQELEKKFGNYDVVRKNAIGILQATDLGIVRGQIISNVSEELMLATPGYWLAPCLVALAAWINDQKELAERALKEGINRDDEKASLFFALICRRADRKSAALKWTQRFLSKQDPENLDRNTIIILDAFASGLLGSDSEGVVSKQIGDWLGHLADKPGFVEQQKGQWADAINLKRKPIAAEKYPYLRKFSRTWPILNDIMEGAELHAEILSYFTAIFDQECSDESLKAQLDEILTSLVTEFDSEELPLKKEEKFNQFIVAFNGDKIRARQNMQVEQTAFETHKDFTQLLTDAAMKPESSGASVSTQKFAIALSKDWITEAYQDVVLNTRQKVPAEIEINIDTFNSKTTNGENEEELIKQFDALVDREQANALASCAMTGFANFCLWGGAAIAVIGLIMMFFEHPFLGLIAIIAGIGMVINHFSKKKKVEQQRQQIEEQFKKKRHNGKLAIRATLAEVVDFRAEFGKKDKESEKVFEFLEQISPEQYVRKLASSNRRINVNN